MPDVHSKATRSYNMKQIKGKNTRPEMLVRKFLHALGFRYKLHDKSLPGAPDLVLPCLRTVIFVHGCFWHKHENCRYFVVPGTRRDWWMDKIGKNVANDRKAGTALVELGWRVLIVWECDLKIDKINETLANLAVELYAGPKSF